MSSCEGDTQVTPPDPDDVEVDPELVAVEVAVDVPVLPVAVLPVPVLVEDAVPVPVPPPVVVPVDGAAPPELPLPADSPDELLQAPAATRVTTARTTRKDIRELAG